MEEKKVWYHNPGLFPVPGRCLLSLSSGKILKKVLRSEVSPSFEEHSSFPDIKYSISGETTSASGGG